MKGYIQWVGGSILFALIVIQYSTCNKFKAEYKEQSNLITSMQDTISHFRNKEGENSAQIALLEGDKENLLIVIGKNDKRITNLIKYGAKSGTVINQVTKIDTVTVIEKDTVDGSLIYHNTVKNKWYSIDQTIKDDSSSINLELRDSISVSFQKVKQGFLKPKKSVVVVSNANPYVKTTGLRAFDIPQKKSNLKFWLGVGLGAGAGYLLFTK